MKARDSLKRDEVGDRLRSFATLLALLGLLFSCKPSPRPVSIAGVSFSPDGSRIAVSLAKEEDSQRTEMRLYETATGQQTAVLQRTKSHLSTPSWAPDGSALTYSNPHEETSDNVIWVLEIKTGQRRALAKGVNPRWSPKGDFIAFETNDPVQIFLVEPGNSLVTPVSESATNNHFLLDWSPDGQWLAYGKRFNPDLAVCLYGPHDEQRHLFANKYSCEWSPDGHQLTVAESEGGALVTIDLSSGTVVPFPGRNINLSTVPGRYSFTDPSGYEQIQSPDGRTFNTRFRSGKPVWSPDGEYLLLYDWLGSDISLFDAQGNKVWATKLAW